MQILTNIRLTNSQKEVLSKTFAFKDNPQGGWEAITSSSNVKNLIAAKNILLDIGLLSKKNGGGYVPTNKGIKVMKGEGLIDDETGELTDAGNTIVYGTVGKPAEEPTEPEPETDEEPSTEPKDEEPEDDLTGGEETPKQTESLMQSINNHLIDKRYLLDE